jgi:hypothetical protein
MGTAPHFAPEIDPFVGTTPHNPPLSTALAPPHPETSRNNTVLSARRISFVHSFLIR